MTKIVLDTNAYSEFMAGNQSVFDHIIESDNVYISTVVLGELYAGFRGGNRYATNNEELKRFLTKNGVTIIDVTKETAEIFGEIKAVLSKQGKMIPLNDIWIAAHSIETGSILITFDSHFKNIPGLRLWEMLQ